MTDRIEETRVEVPEGRLPKPIAPGLTWLGACLELPFVEGQVLHSYHSAWLVQGAQASLLVDTGHPKDWLVLESQMDELLRQGAAPPAYLFPTHAEVAHSANLGRWLRKFPDAVVCGDVRDYHLVFPEYAHRLRRMKAGEEIDLGDTGIVFLEALIRDHPTSMWGYDPKRRVLFTADGFAYTHHHAASECGKTLEQLPLLPVSEYTALTAKYAYYWTRFADMEPFITRLRSILTTDYPTEFVAPAHGCPVGNPAAAMPLIFEGLRLIRTL